MTRCVHMNFKADCRVGRLTDGDGGPVTGYTMDVVVFARGSADQEPQARSFPDILEKEV